MSEEDRRHWDVRHASAGGPDQPEAPGVPEVFAPYEAQFPSVGLALDLACGRGASSVWLATLGLEVWGFDISTVGLQRARRLAAANKVAGRCRFRPADLDQGLPVSPPADVILCHMFRDPRLYGAMIERLKIGGLLAIALLSEVGAQAGAFRAGAGEMKAAFDGLSVLAEGEGAGRAWLLARK
jgi:SAM-dependent methyltransferase